MDRLEKLIRKIMREELAKAILILKKEMKENRGSTQLSEVFSRRPKPKRPVPIEKRDYGSSVLNHLSDMMADDYSNMDDVYEDPNFIYEDITEEIAPQPVQIFEGNDPISNMLNKSVSKKNFKEVLKRADGFAKNMRNQ